MFCFSGRRRHTSYIGDWSSDVCSSDLQLLDRARRAPPEGGAAEEQVHPVLLRRLEHRVAARAGLLEEEGGGGLGPHDQVQIGRASCREKCRARGWWTRQ